MDEHEPGPDGLTRYQKEWSVWVAGRCKSWRACPLCLGIDPRDAFAAEVDTAGMGARIGHADNCSWRAFLDAPSQPPAGVLTQEERKAIEIGIDAIHHAQGADHWTMGDLNNLQLAANALNKLLTRSADSVPPDGDRVAVRREVLETVSCMPENLGIAIHTAFRKAVDSTTACSIWNDIHQMKKSEWREIIRFVADSLGMTKAAAEAEAALASRGETTEGEDG